MMRMWDLILWPMLLIKCDIELIAMERKLSICQCYFLEAMQTLSYVFALLQLQHLIENLEVLCRGDIQRHMVSNSNTW